MTRRRKDEGLDSLFVRVSGLLELVAAVERRRELRRAEENCAETDLSESLLGSTELAKKEEAALASRARPSKPCRVREAVSFPYLAGLLSLRPCETLPFVIRSLNEALYDLPADEPVVTRRFRRQLPQHARVAGDYEAPRARSRLSTRAMALLLGAQLLTD